MPTPSTKFIRNSYCERGTFHYLLTLQGESLGRGLTRRRHTVAGNLIRKEAPDITHWFCKNKEKNERTTTTLITPISSLIRLFSWFPRQLVSWYYLHDALLFYKWPARAECIATHWLTRVLCYSTMRPSLYDPTSITLIEAPGFLFTKYRANPS